MYGKNKDDVVNPASSDSFSLGVNLADGLGFVETRKEVV